MRTAAVSTPAVARTIFTGSIPSPVVGPLRKLTKVSHLAVHDGLIKQISDTEKKIPDPEEVLKPSRLNCEFHNGLS